MEQIRTALIPDFVVLAPQASLATLLIVQGSTLLYKASIITTLTEMWSTLSMYFLKDSWIKGSSTHLTFWNIFVQGIFSDAFIEEKMYDYKDVTWFMRWILVKSKMQDKMDR